jgi:hypothetical protein
MLPAFSVWERDHAHWAIGGLAPDAKPHGIVWTGFLHLRQPVGTWRTNLAARACLPDVVVCLGRRRDGNARAHSTSSATSAAAIVSAGGQLLCRPEHRGSAKQTTVLDANSRKWIGWNQRPVLDTNPCSAVGGSGGACHSRVSTAGWSKRRCPRSRQHVGGCRACPQRRC